MASIFKHEAGILCSEVLSFRDTLEPPEAGIIQKTSSEICKSFHKCVYWDPGKKDKSIVL